MKLNTQLGAALLATSLSAAIAAAPPSTSAYFTDAQQSYVQDRTSESIGNVNMIACIMHSLRPDALVNQDPYAALVDKNVCDSAKSGGASSATGASAAAAPAYINAVVDSTRASNSDPMLVKAWLSIDQDGTPVTVFAHISATEAPSSANPYGAFRLDYCGRTDGVSGCVMNGFMEGGSGTLSYFEIDNSGNGGGTTALQLTSVGTTTGSGSVSVDDPHNGSSAFDFSYDQTYFLRDDPQGGSQCFSRDASDPETGFSVWQYGLYDSATGARVDRNSGFPVQYTQGGTTYQGFLGYYGLSLPSQAITTGTTVQKVDYNSGSSPVTTDYTAVVNGGRLTRYTKKQRTLKDIDQIHLNAFVNAVGSSGLPDANAQYEMYWDDASGKFIVTAEMQCGPGGCQTSNLPTNIPLDASFFAGMGGVQGWSQSLGGDVFVNLQNVSGAVDSTTSATVPVIYHVQDMVYPDDGNKPATLYCVSNCPTATTLQAYFTQQGNSVQSPYTTATASFQPVVDADVVTYSLDSNAQLTGGDGGTNAAVFTDASAYQQFPQYQNGVMSGKLFTDKTFALCNSNQYCDWAVNSTADVYYQWQTGPNTWNQFAAVKDSTGAFVHFDAPLNVNFQVPDEAAYGSYRNTSLILQYSGFGNLNGIPGSCVSATTNLPVDCANDPSVRYVPQFVIPYDPSASPQQGVVTTTDSGVTTTYLVKWLNREIRFARKNASVCSGDGLTAPTNVVLPTQSQLKNPSDSSSDVYLGTQPTVTGAPRVIQGDVKY